MFLQQQHLPEISTAAAAAVSHLNNTILSTQHIVMHGECQLTANSGNFIFSFT